MGFTSRRTTIRTLTSAKNMDQDFFVSRNLSSPDPKKPQIRSTWTHGWDSRNPRWGPKRILRTETEMEDHTHFGKCKTHPRQFRVTEAWKHVSSSSEFIPSSPPNPEPQQGSNGLELSTYGRIRENGMEGMERRIEKSSYGLNQIS